MKLKFIQSPTKYLLCLFTLITIWQSSFSQCTGIYNVGLWSATPVTTNNSIAANFGSFVSGQIYVKENNSCGSSAERSLTVYARAPAPTSITGPVSVCDGDSNVNYSTIAVANASIYN